MRQIGIMSPPQGTEMAKQPCETETVPGVGGDRLNVRVWRASPSVETVVMLHGLISHSGWLAPVAEDLATRGITSVCPDRRGSGANPGPRGDAPSGAVLLDDLDCVLDRFEQGGAGAPPGGGCWGGACAGNSLGLRRRPGRPPPPLPPAILPAASGRRH